MQRSKQRILLLTAHCGMDCTFPVLSSCILCRISKTDYIGLQFFSVTSTKVSELNSIFKMNSNMFLVFLYHARFLSDIQL
jgi:hypothetical protein